MSSPFDSLVGWREGIGCVGSLKKVEDGEELDEDIIAEAAGW